MATPRIPQKFIGKVTHRPSYVVNPKKVYFKAYEPLELKKQLTGRDAHTKKTPCIPLLIEMMDCLKRVGFVDSPCREQILAFKNCNEAFKVEEQARKDQAEEDLTAIKSVRDMKRDQVNIMLRNFHNKK